MDTSGERASNALGARRKHIQLELCDASFVDLSCEVKEVGEYPVNGGAFCDVHVGILTNGTTVALKKLRLYKGLEIMKKVSFKE